jgi:hypothetical protein
MGEQTMGFTEFHWDKNTTNGGFSLAMLDCQRVFLQLQTKRICMYARMHACMYACIYVCMHVCMYIYIEREREKEYTDTSAKSCKVWAPTKTKHVFKSNSNTACWSTFEVKGMWVSKKRKHIFLWCLLFLDKPGWSMRSPFQSHNVPYKWLHLSPRT